MRGTGKLNQRALLAVNDLVAKAGSQPSVEPSEIVGKIQRHDQDARPEHQHVRGLAQIEAADTTNQEVSDGKVEEAPYHIDYRGGQAHPRWRCKGALEGMS
jgi:hypothetical protein